MTAFLLREQELIKINENLDKITKMAFEKTPPTKPIDSKYATFTKRSRSNVIRQNAKTLESFNQTMKENKGEKKGLSKERPIHGIVEEKKNIFERNSIASPTERSSLRALPLARTSNSNSTTTSNAVLRYKNSSFVQSPSLEILVRDENESIRSLASSRTSELSGGTSTARPKINLSSEGLVKYLKSRIVILQTEHDKTVQELACQKELAEKSVEKQKKVEAQRDLAYSRNNALSEQVTRLEVQLEEAVKRLKETDLEHNTIRKELENTKRDLKVMSQSHANLEKRLYRANEELENTRNSLNQLKNSEKEMKETKRSDNEARDKQIKGLKKQRADLLNAYKKQLFLIDNLKRQNMCMEQSRMIQFGEKEFTKVLDWQAKA